MLQIDRQVGEPYVIHRQSAWQAAKAQGGRAARGRPSARARAERAKEYPHQFSGGMQQRAMIAMGLALEPELLIADEPTTALDVTVQAQVLRLLREIRETHGTAILFITHDLGVVAELCDWVYVIYAGAILEQGSVAGRVHPARPPLHPGPAARDADRAQRPGRAARRSRARSHRRSRCRRAAASPTAARYRFERCADEPPALPVEPGHDARCWLLDHDR